MEIIFQAIGKFIVAGGGLVAISYGLFKYLGRKWLDEKFSERLEAYKHEQQKEIERLRFKINALLDRATKFHQREYEVLPEAWSLLNDSFWKASSFLHPLQQYPDLDKMTPTQLEEYISNCPFNKWEIEELKASTTKTDYYIKRIFWHTIHDIKSTARDCHVYLAKNGIFLQPDLLEKFRTIDDAIWKALNQKEISERHDIIPRDLTKSDYLLEQGPQLLKELELLVQNRLWNTLPETL